ncbi:hypothetical protein K461DRAFT_314391 [Myriangium duriaei CBS 260.36]|uniref:Uncharacterized protein n=1 Tax=Myriangium duriaei CBS 260.36 TaxID=1168546 RepID=A0A9P4MK14_9PEZI|nr:hypothetical protein K461DRAFT_314391 [Myriangium duriaei CBS 260.36]
MGTKRKSPEPDLPKPPHTKLPALPDGYIPSKRPLLHPPLPSPNSSSPKTIYISHRTPFLSAASRTTKLLASFDKRDAQSALASARQGKGKAKGFRSREGDVDAAAATLARAETGVGEVVLKGTGRAVEKTLSLGLWLRERGFGVRIRTGSVGTVDDVVRVEGKDVGVEEGGEEVHGGEDEDREEEDVPLARMRYTSVVEVWVSRAG